MRNNIKTSLKNWRITYIHRQISFEDDRSTSTIASSPVAALCNAGWIIPDTEAIKKKIEIKPNLWVLHSKYRDFFLTIE